MSIGPGVILREKYRLEQSIGSGGMGEVFEATTLAGNLKVAIKVVNRTIKDPLLVERLRREAEAARRINSEFIPRLFDVDTTAEGELFVCMELLSGEPFSTRLWRRGGVLAWEEVAQLGDDILRGLIDAHAAGVVHRDLKPGNIFVEAFPDRPERARILDFGVCKLDVHDGEQLTTTGEAVGTIAYMAPEQIRGASKVDERADIYAFGMVVFEAICGRLAYEAGGSIALIASKLERQALGLRGLNRVPVPAGLEQLLARCLSREPSDRPASAAALLNEWRALRSLQVAETPMTLPVIPPTVALDPAMTVAPTVITAVTRPNTRAGLFVAAGAVVLSCAVLLIAIYQWSSFHRASGAVPSDDPAASASAAITPFDPATSGTVLTVTAPTIVDLLPPPPPPPTLTLVPPTPPHSKTTPWHPPAGHGGPSRSGAVGSSTGAHPSSQPQIVTEPRY